MQTWKFLNNTFLSSTALSMSKCFHIANHTLIILKGRQAEEPFGTLYNNLLPAFTEFQSHYTGRMGAKGTIKSKTFGMKKLIAELRSERISEWAVQIEMLHRRGTPAYIGILPKGRKPFQVGPQQDRIDAVGRLAAALEPYPTLASLRAEVQAFYDTITAAKKSQNTSKQGKKITTNELKHAREAVCIELYGILGALMQHYKHAPHQARIFFDLTAIKQKHQKSYTHNLKPAETRHILTHTFEPTDEIRLINKGETLLQFSLCRQANSAVVQPIVSVPANSEKTVSLETLGDVSYRFLKVKNLNATIEGRYWVVIP